MTVDTIYLGHDNTVDLVLKVDNVAFDLSSVTSITATFGDVTITSTLKATGTITWDQAGYATGEIRIDMGGPAILVTDVPGSTETTSLTASKKPYDVPIVTYDAANTTGIVWGKHRILVKAEVEAS